MKLTLFLATGLWLAAVYSRAQTIPERWQAPGGEFTVQFSGKPRATYAEANPAQGASHLDMATFERSGEIEHAEASANRRTRPITNNEAVQIGEAWAKLLNVTDAKMSFDEFRPDDKKLTVKGNKVIDGVPMNIMAVMHWGKKTFLLVWVAEPPKVFLSPAGSQFVASVHQNWL